MLDAVFLPLDADHADDVDVVAVQSALKALLHVTVGRRLLVCANSGFFEDMAQVAVEDMGFAFSDWVKTYASDRPEDDVTKALATHNFASVVYVGGATAGTCNLATVLAAQPHAAIVAVASTGGTAARIADEACRDEDALRDDMDYVTLFHEYLEVPVTELRFETPAKQPDGEADRQYVPKPRAMV